MLPLPYAHWERGVRRYGFHGLSYEYMSVALAERHGDAARGRMIVAHLGSGASLCAMRERSAATTMGFSALEGLMMGTRCGSLDPGVVLYLPADRKAGAAELERVLYRESGLLGVSGLSPSPENAARSRAHQPPARAALELYVRRIVREIGALTAVLGGLDMLVFTAGVGERSAALRERICAAPAGSGSSSSPMRTAQMHRRSRAREPRAGRRGADQRGMDRGVPRRARAVRRDVRMSLNTESKYPSRRAYVVKMRSDAKPGELAGRVENLVTGSSREFANGEELLESLANDLAASAEATRGTRRHEAMTDQRDPVYRALWTEDLEEVDREIVRLATLCQVRYLSRGDWTRAEKRRFGVRNGELAAFRKLHDLLMLHLAIREKAVESFGQAQAAAIEDYVIERLRKSFPDLPGRWPPA